MQVVLMPASLALCIQQQPKLQELPNARTCWLPHCAHPSTLQAQEPLLTTMVLLAGRLLPCKAAAAVISLEPRSQSCWFDKLQPCQQIRNTADRYQSRLERRMRRPSGEASGRIGRPPLSTLCIFSSEVSQQSSTSAYSTRKESYDAHIAS